MRPAYRPVGTVVGIHGSRGEVRFRPAGDAGCPVAKEQRVALVPPTLEDRRYKEVAGVREDRGGLFLRFEDVTDRGAAGLCVGRTVLVPVEELPEGWGSGTDAGLIGLEVDDAAAGRIGLVVAVDEGPVQSLLVVEGDFGEVLIPAVEPILGEVVDGVLQVDCPTGLLELARGGEG